MKKIVIKSTDKGITIIALSITIIILLILSGVTIALLVRDNGILFNVFQAKENTSETTALEKVELKVLDSYDVDGILNYEYLQNNLRNLERFRRFSYRKITNNYSCGWLQRYNKRRWNSICGGFFYKG